MPNAAGAIIHYTGGLRAAKISDDTWQIVPVLVNGDPSIVGPLSINQVNDIATNNKFERISFNQYNWIDGNYSSFRRPIVFELNNRPEGPTNLWSNIARNLGTARIRATREDISDSTRQLGFRELDNASPPELLAKSISLSLRNVDASVEQIVEGYHQSLMSHMSAGLLNCEKRSTFSETMDHHVHSFFLHVGAARDYLAALIAYRASFNEKKTDSMARLVDKIRLSLCPPDALLSLLLETGNVSPIQNKTERVRINGWLQEVTDVRNLLIHNRPYGSNYNETFGWIIPMEKDAGIYRYFRPIELNKSEEYDLLDVVHYHYSRCVSLMYKAALLSGYDSGMLEINASNFKTSRPRK